VKNNMNTCYACGQPATSVEHVPPKCIFPEIKDAAVDFRKNLITVPSCDVHNTAKSQDDEFLLLALVVYIGNNKAGKQHFLTKVMRAVQRMPGAFRKRIDDSFPVVGTPGAGAALQFDRDRFDHEIEMIVRALYFHETSNILTLPVLIESPMFHIRDGPSLTSDAVAQQTAAGVRAFIGSNTPLTGENPDIFRYRFRHEPSENLFAIEMLFYEHFQVVGSTIPATTPPVATASEAQEEAKPEAS
jgi:hypothetical protein